MVRGRIVQSVPPSHPCLLYLSATETTSTSWTSCDQFAHCLLRLSSALSGGMIVPHTKTSGLVSPLAVAWCCHAEKGRLLVKKELDWIDSKDQASVRLLWFLKISFWRDLQGHCSRRPACKRCSDTRNLNEGELALSISEVEEKSQDPVGSKQKRVA